MLAPHSSRRLGRKVRQIDKPIGGLLFIQRLLKERLLATFPFPHALHGGIRGRSQVSNVGPHLNQRLVVHIGLKDFYPSVSCRMVYAVWRDQFGLTPPIAGQLTRLTTYKGHLPQGASTSGYLANLVLVPVASQIQAIASEHGCHVTFFVDDITVSGDRALEALNPIIAIIERHGLSLRHGKTQVMRSNRPQIVTGLSVNGRTPSVPQPKSDRVRESVHELKLRRAVGQDVAKLERSIQGRIAHVRRTNKGRADRLSRLLLSAAGDQPAK